MRLLVADFSPSTAVELQFTVSDSLLRCVDAAAQARQITRAEFFSLAAARELQRELPTQAPVAALIAGKLAPARVVAMPGTHSDERRREGNNDESAGRWHYATDTVGRRDRMVFRLRLGTGVPRLKQLLLAVELSKPRILQAIDRRPSPNAGRRILLSGGDFSARA
jgi:hypothetical protein